MYAHLCTCVYEEISKYAREATLRSCASDGPCFVLFASGCIKSRRTRERTGTTSEATKCWFSVYGVVLRRFVESRLHREKTTQGSKDSRRSILNFNRVIESDGALPTPRQDSSGSGLQQTTTTTHRLPASLNLLYRAIYKICDTILSIILCRP